MHHLVVFYILKVPSIIRNSKWNSDNWTKGRFTTNIDPECLTVYDVFRRGQKHSSRFTMNELLINISIYFKFLY